MEPIWTINDVAAYLQVSKRTAERIAARPGFPAPMRVSARALRWEPEVVRRWARATELSRPATRSVVA